MKLRCAVCQHVQEAEHVAVRCGGCGSSKAMQMVATVGGLRPGEPICGPSRVPISGGSRAAMRGAYEEPVEVTRERWVVYMGLLDTGLRRPDALRESRRRVPVQCGRCGGDDAGCPVCGGLATAPTEALRAARAPRAASKRGSRRPKRVARVAD